ncbi:MAG: hypothetical protein IPJ19_06715 [Planctomycetes bacterium]|nr:hypothetical protein [Planctomycetota bacterium]
MRLLATLLLALASSAVLPGCGQSQGNHAAPHAMNGLTPPSFLDQIADAPFQVAYHARRRVWQSFQDASGPQTLEYTESVWSDGQGHFNVTPEQVLQPAMNPQAEQVFLLLQRSREGFLYRLRDFRIRELNAFLQSYTIQDTGKVVDVAGVNCNCLRVDPANSAPSYWELDVDPSTGLILATREFGKNAQPVGVVETLAFDLNPDLSSVVLHQDLAAVPFTATTAHQVLGFVPLQPTFLPQGFTQTAAEKVSQGADDWARFAYTDGAETLFVLYHRDPIGTTPASEPSGPYTLRIFRAGLWSVAQATFGRHRIVALGRQPGDVLAQVVESCAH